MGNYRSARPSGGRLSSAFLWPILFVFALVGCNSPTRPTTTTVAGRPLSPASSATYSFYDQPVTLGIHAGTSTGGAPTLRLEVATDDAFTSMVFTKTVPDTSGRIVVTLDRLKSASYFWRVVTIAPDGTTLMSPVSIFTIGPELLIEAPTPLQPSGDALVHKRPTFVVANSARTGPATPLTYHVDVATDAGFAHLVESGDAPEADAQTSITPNADLKSGVRYYWRARAIAAALGVMGPYSAARPVTTVFPDDGDFRYTLHLYAPDYCLTHAVVSASFFGQTGSYKWTQSKFSFAGTLRASDDRLTYDIDQGEYTAQSAIVLRRTQARVTAQVPDPTGPWAKFGIVDVSPLFGPSLFIYGSMAGETDNQGNFSGMLDGDVTQMLKPGFPYDVTASCTTSGFTWSLRPR